MGCATIQAVVKVIFDRDQNASFSGKMNWTWLIVAFRSAKGVVLIRTSFRGAKGDNELTPAALDANRSLSHASFSSMN